MIVSEKSISLIAFLGNPGRQYANTRHNIAWMLLDCWEGQKHLTWKAKFKGRYSKYQPGSKPVILLKPETFMNKSGESIQSCAWFFKIAPQKILIVHDDLELPFGILDIKQGGGLAGHNGLKSTATALGSRGFWRMRLGISRPARGKASAHVLGKFTEEEQTLLEQFMEKAGDIIDACLSESIDNILEKYSKTDIIGNTNT